MVAPHHSHGREGLKPICAPNKCHQSQLEQNGFNQLRHPHSPGSRATKGSAPAPEDSKAYVSLHTAGSRLGRRVGDRRTDRGKGRWLEHRKAKGPWPVLVPQGLAQYSCPRSLARERSRGRDRGVSPSSRRSSSSSCLLHQ